MNISGIIIGFACFVIIGAFHPIVIKCEYYFTSKIWPIFLIAGIIFCGLSLMIESEIFSGIVGVIGFCCFWSIHEIKKQSERVARGWFPKNPKREKKSRVI